MLLFAEILNLYENVFNTRASSRMPMYRQGANVVMYVYRRSSLGGFGRSHAKASSATQPRLDYRSMVSVDDMPDLFASFDSKYTLSQIDH